MEIFDLKMEDLIKSCRNQDLVESVHDKIRGYHALRDRLKLFRDKNQVLNSDLIKLKINLSKAFTETKLGLIHYKFMMLDESLNEVEGVNRFYNKEEFSEYCKSVEQSFAQSLNGHIFLLIYNPTVPPMLVCSQTESMIDSNKYYVHGWSENGRKLYRYSNKVEW